VQSVLIASVVGLVANIIINVWATLGAGLTGMPGDQQSY
jgi:hypothetical protein